MTTRGRKILRWRPALAHAVEALLAVDAYVFGGGIRPQRPTVEFEDSVQEDPLSLANTADVLRRAQAASTDTLVRMGHPEWDEAMVAAEVARINAESGRTVEDPFQSEPCRKGYAPCPSHRPWPRISPPPSRTCTKPRRASSWSESSRRSSKASTALSGSS
ncbi:hypothetical protein [Streptomyces sp. SGAir0957]